MLSPRTSYGLSVRIRLARRLDHPAVVCVLVAALYGLLLMRLLERHDAAYFVQAGTYFTDPAQAPPNLSLVTDSTGYDGQFYYRLALNPFSRENPAFGITLDNPRYRHQRILYPLLAYALSFGSPPLVVYSLLLTNFLALAALGWLGGAYAQAAGRHALWGAALALYAGHSLTLTRDLAEIVEAVCVLAGLLALHHRRWLAAALLLALALLAKETALLAAAAVGGWWAWARWRRQPGPPAYAWLIPAAVYLTWQAWLLAWWRLPTYGALGHNLGWPLVGLLDGFRQSLGRFPGSTEWWVAEVAVLAVFGVLVLASLRRSAALLPVKLAWVACLALLLLLTGNVWIEDLAFLRAASLFGLFGLAVLLHAPGWLARLALAGSVLGWAAMTLRLALRL